MSEAQSIYDLIVSLLYAPMIAVHVGAWVWVHFTKGFVVGGWFRHWLTSYGAPSTGAGWRRLRKTLTFVYAGLIAGGLAYWIWPQHPQYTKGMIAVINALLSPAITMIAMETLKRFDATKGIAEYLGANDPYADKQGS